MDTAERELFAGAVGRAIETSSDGTLDAALDELGWHDALAADRRVAVSVLFEGQGAANVTSAGLDRLLAAGAGTGRHGRGGRPAPAAHAATHRATWTETGAESRGWAPLRWPAPTPRSW